MWELYDALISKIPDDIEVTKFLSGSSMITNQALYRLS